MLVIYDTRGAYDRWVYAFVKLMHVPEFFQCG